MDTARRTTALPGLWTETALVLYIVALSGISLLYTYPNALIYGDVIFPLSADAISRFMSTWSMTVGNGGYFVLNNAAWLIPYRILGGLGLDHAASTAMFIFLLNLCAGTGVYAFCRSGPGNPRPMAVAAAATLAVFSPALLNGGYVYLPFFIFPWFAFFAHRLLSSPQMRFGAVAGVAVTAFLAATDLPNPKYMFHFFVAYGAFACVALLSRPTASALLNIVVKSVLVLTCCLWFILPNIQFLQHYNTNRYDVKVKQGYKDTGIMMDYGTATVDKMVTMHHDGLNVDHEVKENYLGNSTVIFLGFAPFFIVLLFLLMKNNNLSETNISILILTIAYLCFSIGPNPPFGYAYTKVVSSIPPLAFLRTTAGAVFFLSFCYSIFIFWMLNDTFGTDKKHLAYAAATICIVFVISYPIVQGKFFRNPSRHAMQPEIGTHIPEEYFNVKPFVDNKKIISKYLYSGLLGYISTDWGYFGPFFGNFLYDVYFIDRANVFSQPQRHNVGYVFQDDSTNNSTPSRVLDTYPAILQDNWLTVRTLFPDRFMPRIHVPEAMALAMAERPGAPEATPPDTVILDTLANQPRELEALARSPVFGGHRPQLELRMLDQTRYRVVVHGARQDFMLVLSEAFHPLWKLYTGPRPAAADSGGLDAYQALPGNEAEQASRQQVRAMLDAGLLSALGRQFVSKNFHGTIQNDNIAASPAWDHWWDAPLLGQDSHFVADYYANAWRIDLDAVRQSGMAVERPDGSIDFTLDIEFRAEHVYRMSMLASGLFAALYLCLGLWRGLRRTRAGA